MNSSKSSDLSNFLSTTNLAERKDFCLPLLNHVKLNLPNSIFFHVNFVLLYGKHTTLFNMPKKLPQDINNTEKLNRLMKE